MNQSIVSAVFDSRSEAERAVSELRSAGIADNAISLVGQRDDGKTTETDASGKGVDGDGLVKGLAAGAAGGALLGITALAIPGVGPLVAAGAIAESAIGGAAATGAVIGGTAGGLAGALSKHGVSDEDARYYEDRVHQGGIFVSVDTSRAGIPAETASDILYRHGGHSASRARGAATTY